MKTQLETKCLVIDFNQCEILFCAPRDRPLPRLHAATVAARPLSIISRYNTLLVPAPQPQPVRHRTSQDAKHYKSPRHSCSPSVIGHLKMQCITSPRATAAACPSSVISRCNTLQFPAPQPQPVSHRTSQDAMHYKSPRHSCSLFVIGHLKMQYITNPRATAAARPS